MKRFLLAAGAVMAILAPVSARAQTADWQGPYAGVSLGGVSFDATATDVDGYNSTGEEIDASGDGWGGGGQVGYDWRWGNWVFGGMLDAQFLDADGSGASDFFGGDTSANVSVDSLITARARGGFVFGDSALFYVSAGFGWLSGDLSMSDTSTSVGTATLTGSNDDSDATTVYGAGFEFRVTDNSTLGFDYLRLDADDVTVTGTCGGTCSGEIDFDFEHEYDFYKVTWNWSF